MTTKSLGKNSAPKTVAKQSQNKNNKKTVSVQKSSQKFQKKVVSDSESADEAFFQDSDDAEMDWSEVDSDEESFEEDSDEEADSDDFEEDSDEEEELGSEEEEDFIDDSEEEFVDDSEEENDDEEEEDDDEEMDSEISEAESADLELRDLKEKDLIVPSAISHANNPLLQFFWKLADLNKAVRLEAVSGLVEHIKASQAVFVAPTEVSKAENILSLYDSGALASKCCSDLTYTVKRFIKGLGSSRDSSRLGFMLALLAVYHSFTEILDAEVVLTWSMKLTSPESLGGTVKNREERLLYVARIFALAALFRTKLGSTLSVSSKQAAIDALISVGKKKSFLRESAVEVITCAVDDSELSSYTLKKLASSSALMTETLAFAIMATSRYGLVLEKKEASDKEFPAAFSEFSDLKNLLSRANEEPLMNILKETPCFENRLHTIWDLVLDSLDQEGCFTTDDFLNKVIESIFLNSTGLIKRWTGLNLLKRVVEMKKSGSIGFIFTPVVLRMIKGALGTLNTKSSAMAGKEVAAFNTAVIQFFRDLIDRATESRTDTDSSPEFAMDLILNLSKLSSGVAGKNLLDELAGDDEKVAKLYLCLTSANVIVLIDNISKDISVDFESQNQSLAIFQAPFDKLIGLVKNEKLIKLESSSEWINHLIAVMAKIVTESREMKEELVEIVKGRFFALLNELTDSKRFAEINWIERTAKMFLEAASGSKSTSFSVKIDEPTSDALANLKTVEKLLKTHKIEPERFSKAVLSLQNYLAILLFLDPIDAIPVCAELSECLESHFSKSSKKAKSQTSLEAVMPVLVDILMTFLSKASQLTRKMCDDIFRNIIPFLSSESLSVLFQILKIADKGELFEEVDDSVSAEEDSEEEVEEVGNDVSTVEAIDNAMKSSSAADNSDSELSDVDDDQMMAFDDKLAEIFREKRKALAGSSSKARTQETKRSMVQFKFKVLELVNQAFKSGDLPVSVRIASIEALIEVISSNLPVNGSSSNVEQKQFFAKLESFFAEAFGRPSRNPTEVDAKNAEAMICNIIESICNEEKMISHAAVLPRAAQCVWYLVKVCRSQKIDESKIKSKFAQLVEFSVSVEESRFRVFRSFVFTWSNWDLQLIAPLLASMPEQLKTLLVLNAIRPFQRNQLFEFLTSLLKRAQSFNEQASALKMLELFSRVFTETYTPELSSDLKKMKVDFFKDDIKFIQFCSKKHREMDSESGSAAWSLVLSTGLSNVEEFWKSQANPNNAVKSFLGLLKSAKQ